MIIEKSAEVKKVGQWTMDGHIQRTFSLRESTERVAELKQWAGEVYLALGLELLWAKLHLPYGDWLDWLEHSVDFKTRTAQRLMRLARKFIVERQLGNPQRPLTILKTWQYLASNETSTSF